MSAIIDDDGFWQMMMMIFVVLLSFGTNRIGEYDEPSNQINQNVFQAIFRVEKIQYELLL
jgi:hypothetical protein